VVFSFNCFIAFVKCQVIIKLTHQRSRSLLQNPLTGLADISDSSGTSTRFGQSCFSSLGQTKNTRSFHRSGIDSRVYCFPSRFSVGM
jgi:hypothetical protein